LEVLRAQMAAIAHTYNTHVSVYALPASALERWIRAEGICHMHSMSSMRMRDAGATITKA
jgi:hypothetical protein